MAKGRASGSPSGRGKRIGEDARSTLGVIERWKQTAADEVDGIGGWRDADPGDRLHKFWSDPVRHKDTEHGGTMPRMFYTDTAYLLGWVASNHEKLDPTPLQDIYDAVAAWHDDHNAERVPEQRVLVRMLDRAVQVVQAMENAIRMAARRTPSDTTEWQSDRDRFRYLVSEMKHRIADAAAWGHMSEVLGLQVEAETLAIRLGFPGAPLTLIRHRKGGTDFERHVPRDEPDAVDVLEFIQHDPLGGFSTGVIGCTRPGEIRGKPGLIEVDFIFNLWKPEAIKSLEAWERAIDGMRADGGQPYRHPRSKALSEAMGEVTRACAMYVATLVMLTEPIQGAVSTPEPMQSAYVPPEQCLPPQLPEAIEMRARWEAQRDTFDAGTREQFRRLDMYFVTRMEADQAAARCEAAADEAADELKDDGKPVGEQVATRVRSLLVGLRDRVRPWYEVGTMLHPGNPGGMPNDPGAEAEAVQELSLGLRSLITEIRPIAEQRRPGIGVESVGNQAPRQGSASAIGAPNAVEGLAAADQKKAPDATDEEQARSRASWPTGGELADAAEISDDTFRRIRTAAGLDDGTKGAESRRRRYSPDEVTKLRDAVIAGNTIKRVNTAKVWEKWTRN